MPDTISPFYKIHLSRYWLVRDEPVNLDHNGLLFHVNQNDYFSTLATILRFYEESINNKNVEQNMRSLQSKTIKNVMNDLLYLDKNYIIVPKNEKFD